MPAHHNLEEYFFEHPRGMAGSWSLAVIDIAGRRRKLSSWMSAWGLAWSAAGDEIWFTASGTGMQAELYAVTYSFSRLLSELYLVEGLR